ncbi:hypothetical protein [Curtobacterium sp. MCJR17_043]|uniref:hypothetical protein n=1 Tax=Curtobacterium sp. MCJR17_043 TaxID=2175660 RepID=UPI0024E01670|nr:hypothetical protein [Curtobacterium sp. MCJR17_043]WIB36407.1 hypothetical protein DEJ15_04465 [Curtobacterium sp. MCJR17_043]
MTEPTDAAPVSQTAQLYDNLRAAILTLDIAPGGADLGARPRSALPRLAHPGPGGAVAARA